MQKRTSITFDELENIGLRIALILFIVIELISATIPAAEFFLSNSLVPLILILLIIFRIILKRITEVQQSLGTQSQKSLYDAVKYLIDNNKKIKSLSIIGTNTRQVYHIVENLQIKADTVKILVYSEMPTLTDIIELWKGQQIRKYYNKLSVKSYDHLPSYFLVIVNDRDACYGFYNPDFMLNPTQTSNLKEIVGPYIVSHKLPNGKAICADLVTLFERLFNNSKTKILYDSDSQ